ncbi:hypothetical protein D3C80_1307420 [compost metagenome]
MALHVVIPHRLLEPVDIEIARPFAEAQAGRQVPFAVSIDGDADIRPQPLAHGRKPADIGIGIVVTHLQLDPGKSILFDGTRRTRQKIVQRE